MALEAEELAEFVAERARRDPKVQKIVEDVRLLDGLREHPGWRRLYARVKEARITYGSSLQRRLMAGQDVSKIEIAYTRGYYDGAFELAEAPEKAEQNLERVARQSWLRAELEQVNEEEGMYPYA